MTFKGFGLIFASKVLHLGWVIGWLLVIDGLNCGQGGWILHALSR